jgi:hypothetical protein
MPRTSITPIEVPSGYAVVPANGAFVASDAVNGNQIRSTGREIIVARNVGAGARTITIASSPDPYGRSGPITALSIPAGALRVFQRFPQAGWAQSNGYIDVNAEHAEVELLVLRTRDG